MVAKTGDSVPLIFLIADGAVEIARNICNDMKKGLLEGGPAYLRLYTFGIG